MIDDLPKRLLDLKFEKHKNLIKTKRSKWIVKKNTANNIKMTGKQYVKRKENTYCLVCEKKTDNKKLGE